MGYSYAQQAAWGKAVPRLRTPKKRETDGGALQCVCSRTTTSTKDDYERAVYFARQSGGFA